ncbi:hypothetical protein E4T63_13630 [Pseudomonas fluorescens]|uniref:Uncharacterized protein n=1 Tax=Pseudomonas fluorescens TaxID=294 RepID=A0AAP8Z036_PSEFL|nr:hypothetical protein E4T63_13630 [Pseudomonas fluorescens]
MPFMLPVGLRLDACPLHKCGGRLLFISTKACVECTDAFASKLAPTGECIPNVGAGLLAKASVKTSDQPGSICGSNCTPRYSASIPSSFSGSTPLNSAIRSIR